MTNEFDIIDHPMVFSLLQELASKEPLALCFLTQGNKDNFYSKWGKAIGQKQSFEYWAKDYLGITLFVYSNSESSYYKVRYLGDREMFVNDKKMGSYLTGFLSKTIKEFIDN